MAYLLKRQNVRVGLDTEHKCASVNQDYMRTFNPRHVLAWHTMEAHPSQPLLSCAIACPLQGTGTSGDASVRVLSLALHILLGDPVMTNFNHSCTPSDRRPRLHTMQSHTDVAIVLSNL